MPLLLVQCSPVITLCLGSIGMAVISGQFHKGTLGKLPFHGYFPKILLKNSMIKNFESHMTVLYPICTITKCVIKGLQFKWYQQIIWGILEI